MKKMTHTGVLIGDARARIKKIKVKLRETKRFWITTNGTKYRKVDGSLAGENCWPIWHLDIGGVEKINEQKP